MTSTSCRSSFEEEEEEEGHAKANNTSPPRKIRRSAAAAAAAASESFPGSTAMRSVRSYASRAPYFATTPLGFAGNEFLPLEGSDLNMQSRKNLQQIEANKLSDDALGMCLFTGFLNSFEMVRLRSVTVDPDDNWHQLAGEIGQAARLDDRRWAMIADEFDSFRKYLMRA